MILAWSDVSQVLGSRISYPGIDRACFRPSSVRGFLLNTLDCGPWSSASARASTSTLLCSKKTWTSSTLDVGFDDSSRSPILQFQLARMHPCLQFLLPYLMWAALLGDWPSPLSQQGLWEVGIKNFCLHPASPLPAAKLQTNILHCPKPGR